MVLIRFVVDSLRDREATQVDWSVQAKSSDFFVRCHPPVHPGSSWRKHEGSKCREVEDQVPSEPQSPFFSCSEEVRSFKRAFQDK